MLYWIGCIMVNIFVILIFLMILLLFCAIYLIFRILRFKHYLKKTFVQNKIIKKKTQIHRERKLVSPFLQEKSTIFKVYKIGKNVKIDGFFDYDIKTSTVFTKITRS